MQKRDEYFYPPSTTTALYYQTQPIPIQLPLNSNVNMIPDPLQAYMSTSLSTKFEQVAYDHLPSPSATAVASAQLLHQDVSYYQRGVYSPVAWETPGLTPDLGFPPGPPATQHSSQLVNSHTSPSPFQVPANPGLHFSDPKWLPESIPLPSSYSGVFPLTPAQNVSMGPLTHTPDYFMGRPPALENYYAPPPHSNWAQSVAELAPSSAAPLNPLLSLPQAPSCVLSSAPLQDDVRSERQRPAKVARRPSLKVTAEPSADSSESLNSAKAPSTDTSESITPPLASTSQATRYKGKSEGRGAKKRRETRQELVNCIKCSRFLARIFKRGTDGELDMPHSFQMTCLDCSVNEETLGSMQISPSTQDSVAPSSLSNKTQPACKRKTQDDFVDNTKCDVCHRKMGIGGCVLQDELQDRLFAIEAVCASCDVKYKRCSDCGAGGGKRLGAGKWRSAELFEKGRKTCSLNHARSTSMTDIENAVCRLSLLTDEDRAVLAEMAFRVHDMTQLTNIAIPEIMEMEEAAKSFIPQNTYEGIKKLSALAWRSMEPYITSKESLISGAERYMAAKWCQIQARKSSAVSPRPDSSESPSPRSSLMFRTSKEMVGWGTAEYQWETGVLFVPCISPFTNNDGFEPTLGLLEDMLEYIEQDIQLKVAALLAEGKTAEAARIRPLTHVWVFVPYLKDTRIRNYMQRKRAFVPLEQYLEENPDARAEYFPPHRPMYIPLERQAGFTTLCKRYEPERDKKVKYKASQADQLGRGR